MRLEGEVAVITGGNMNVNVRGTFLCSRHAIPKMIESGGGSIINCSSVSAVVGNGGTR